MSPKENPQRLGQGLLKNRLGATEKLSPNNPENSSQNNPDDRPERELGHIVNPSAPETAFDLDEFIRTHYGKGGDK